MQGKSRLIWPSGSHFRAKLFWNLIETNRRRIGRETAAEHRRRALGWEPTVAERKGPKPALIGYPGGEAAD